MEKQPGQMDFDIEKLPPPDEDHFKHKATLNSLPRIICTEKRPCKRMVCSICRQERKRYFILAGEKHSEGRGPLSHVTISWTNLPYTEPWHQLSEYVPKIQKALSRKKAPFFIRALGIGKFEKCPHVHFLIQTEQVARLEKEARKFTKVRFHHKAVTDVSELLRYFFEKNFIPTHAYPGRPAGVRLLSGTRGISYGYPTLEWQVALTSKIGPSGLPRNTQTAWFKDLSNPQHVRELCKTKKPKSQLK